MSAEILGRLMRDGTPLRVTYVAFPLPPEAPSAGAVCLVIQWSDGGLAIANYGREFPSKIADPYLEVASETAFSEFTGFRDHILPVGPVDALTIPGALEITGSLIVGALNDGRSDLVLDWFSRTETVTRDGFASAISSLNFKTNDRPLYADEIGGGGVGIQRWSIRRDFIRLV